MLRDDNVINEKGEVSWTIITIIIPGEENQGGQSASTYLQAELSDIFATEKNPPGTVFGHLSSLFHPPGMIIVILVPCNDSIQKEKKRGKKQTIMTQVRVRPRDTSASMLLRLLPLYVNTIEETTITKRHAVRKIPSLVEPKVERKQILYFQRL